MPTEARLSSAARLDKATSCNLRERERERANKELDTHRWVDFQRTESFSCLPRTRRRRGREGFWGKQSVIITILTGLQVAERRCVCIRKERKNRKPVVYLIGSFKKEYEQEVWRWL